MKRILILLSAISIIACCAGCGGNTGNVSDVSAPSSNTKKSENTEKERHKNESEKALEYLGRYIELSLYDEEVIYKKSSRYEIELKPKAVIESKKDRIEPVFELPDYQTIRYGMKYNDLKNAGFLRFGYNGTVESNTGGSASLIISDEPKVYIDIMLFNPTDNTIDRNECIIDSIGIPVENGPEFVYNGLNPETTFEDVISTLGDPTLGAKLISESEKASDINTVRMYYDNHDDAATQTEFKFIFDKENNKMILNEICVYKIGN